MPETLPQIGIKIRGPTIAAGAPEIHGASSPEWPHVVRDGAVHGEATVGANQEGHESIAEKAILGGMRINRKAGRNGCILDQAFTMGRAFQSVV